MVVGRLWGAVFPINKNLWTSSYVVFTAGFACIALATCLWLIDIRHYRRWTKPFVIYGVNPVVELLTARAEEVERVYVAEGARVHDLERIHDLARRAGVRIERVPRERIARLAGGKVHQGVLAEVVQDGLRLQAGIEHNAVISPGKMGDIGVLLKRKRDHLADL